MLKLRDMLFKTDTKEKFHAITLIGPSLTATMTDELGDSLLPFLKTDVKSVVLIMREISDLEIAAAEKLVEIQQQFYESNASFVICHVDRSLETMLDDAGLLEIMNVTPTESEAWDIVQMEEVERELMDGT